MDDDGCRVETYGGVYLFATFAQTPKAEAADHLDRAIFCVGEANRLGRRWYAHHLFTRELRWCNSYVAVLLPVWFVGDEPERSVEPWTRDFRLYAERRILWEITAVSKGMRRLLNRW